MAKAYRVFNTSRDEGGLQIDTSELLLLQNAFKKSIPDARAEAKKATSLVAKKMKTDLSRAGKNSGDKLTKHVASKGIALSRRQVFQGRDGIARASKNTGGYVPVAILGLDKPLPVKRKNTTKNPWPTSLEVWRGSEFGSANQKRSKTNNNGRRFRPANKEGYWFYPEWRRIRDEAAKMWIDSIDVVLKKWSNN